MHRSLIPDIGTSPTRTPSAESSSGVRLGGAVFRVVFFLAIVR